MARAIISEAMSLDDREVNIDNEIKTKIRGVDLSKKGENELFCKILERYSREVVLRARKLVPKFYQKESKMSTRKLG